MEGSAGGAFIRRVGVRSNMVIPLEQWGGMGVIVTRNGGSEKDVIDRMLSETQERVALDLHVGDAYQVDNRDWIAIKDDELVLRPNECVRILVEEEIITPKTVFGQVCSKGDLTPEGVLVANQKVDPNFHGQLELTVFNAASTTVKLERGMAFASMWLGELTHELDDAPVRLPSPTRGVEKGGFRDALRDARPFVITGFVTLAATVLAGVLLEALL
jgi:dCTP deaminase-like protein